MIFSSPYIHTNLLGIVMFESYPIIPSMSIGFQDFFQKIFK